MEWAFNSNVKHELCGQKFCLSVRQPCVLVCVVSVWYFVLHAYLFKVSGFSKVLEIELLSAGLSLYMWRHRFLTHFMTSHIQAALLIQMPIVTMHFHSAWLTVLPSGENLWLHGWRFVFLNITLLQQNNRRQLCLLLCSTIQSDLPYSPRVHGFALHCNYTVLNNHVGRGKNGVFKGTI